MRTHNLTHKHALKDRLQQFSLQDAGQLLFTFVCCPGAMSTGSAAGGSQAAPRSSTGAAMPAKDIWTTSGWHSGVAQGARVWQEK
jgi:hypothetical protein